MSLIENRQIVRIDLIEHVYQLDIAINKESFSDWDQYYFALSNRHSGEVEKVSYELMEEQQSYLIYTVRVPVEDWTDLFQQGDIFDLVFVRTRNDEEKRLRIKSNYDYIEFLQFQLDDHTVFLPGTTKMGNISFYKRENEVISRVEEVKVTEDALLQIKGIYQYPGLAFRTIRNMELIAVSTLTEESFRVPVQPKKLPNHYMHYSWYEGMYENGFSAEIDLKEYFSLGLDQYIKIYLTIEAEIDGEQRILESPRMKVNHLKQPYPLKQKIKKDSSTVQITIKPTKQSKYISIRIAEYKLLREIIRNSRQTWVRIRRSKEVLKLYKAAFFVLGRLLPVDKKLVMFESFHGKQFSDNPRAIYEYMKNQGLDYKLIWSADRRHTEYFKGKDIEFVRRFSIRWLFMMTRSKYWVTNARLPLWIPKPKHTKYLQTWHGTPLKRLATDMEEVHMPGTDAERYKQNFIREASKWDYLISPNRYSSEIFQRAFQFNKEMIESGYPRNDYLYNANKNQDIINLKKSLHLPEDKQVILYAPTWRDNQFYSKGNYKFNLELDLEKLHNTFKETHVIVLRMHYLVAENLDISAYEGFVYDFSTYEDIRDLYLMSDVLITDYSSVFFDFANLRRPMIFFVYDIEDYRDNLRGFYFDFESKAPGPLVKTTEEVIDELQKVEKDFQPSEEYEEFYDRFCYLEDGLASKRVVEHVFNRY